MNNDQSWQQHRTKALLLSLPSLLACLMFLLAQSAELVGNQEIGNDAIVTAVALIAVFTGPLVTAGLAFRTASWWANHGRVPLWLLLTLAGNALVTWYLYKVLRG